MSAPPFGWVDTSNLGVENVFVKSNCSNRFHSGNSLMAAEPRDRPAAQLRRRRRHGQLHRRRGAGGTHAVRGERAGEAPGGDRRPHASSSAPAARSPSRARARRSWAMRGACSPSTTSRCARVAEPPVTGEIRLGITEYFVPNELPGLLARFAARLSRRAPRGAHGVLEGPARGTGPQGARRGTGAPRAARARPRDLERAAGLGRRAGVRARPRPVRCRSRCCAAPCVLRQHALESMRRAKRAH